MKKEKLTLEKETHVYTYGDKEIPSLSQVLDGFFETCPYYTDDSASKGTRIHTACGYLAKGTLNWASLKSDSEEPGGEDFTPYAVAFHKFLRYNSDLLKETPILENRRTIPNPMSLLCGTSLDFLYKKKRVIVELKTGLPQKRSYFNLDRHEMQLNCHLKSVETKTKPADSGYLWTGYLVYIKKNGEYKAIRRSYSEHIQQYFNSALMNWYNKNAKREAK